MARLTFEERLINCGNPLLKNLFSTIIAKKTNLCVAADFRKLEDLANFIDVAGPHICVLKTHLDILGDNEARPAKDLLKKKKKEHNFLVFEDVKYNDEVNYTSMHYEQHVVEYANFITLDRFNQEMLTALHDVVKSAQLPDDEPRGFLGLLELSFSNYPPDPNNYKKCEENPHVCVGIIAQKHKIPPTMQSALVRFSPGVHLTRKNDPKGQNWRDPETVIADGADIIIVGRGITALPREQWEAETIKYKDAAYKAYLKFSSVD